MSLANQWLRTFASASSRLPGDRCPFASCRIAVSCRAASCISSLIQSHHTQRYHANALSSSRQCHLAVRLKVTEMHHRTTPQDTIQARSFKSISEYHDKADDTLHTIQDALEELIEDNLLKEEVDDIPEVNYASGVLTIYLPPHGTWVINKQTPNEQLWWSSPLSGPRRYEYVEERERWVYTRVIDENAGVDCGGGDGEDDTLGHILVEEIKELYGCDLELEV